jgi:hypothetical protein
LVLPLNCAARYSLKNEKVINQKSKKIKKKISSRFANLLDIPSVLSAQLAQASRWGLCEL